MAALPEVVTTPRLTLRVWRDDDAAALSDAVTRSLDHLRPWMGWAERAMSPAEAAAFIAERRARWADGGDATYGVFADGAVAGGTGLHTRHGPATLEIGYWICVEHVGQGYATELSAALTDAAFSVPFVERVEIRHDAANERSRAVPWRLGFSLASVAPEPARAPADSGVEWTWAVSREAWAARTPER
ncbi:MAG TPA: GNAT family protein [Acidimicrobiales bacterium]|nr:GNAT family protein [Acidimicrobiales bacterium]